MSRSRDWRTPAFKAISARSANATADSEKRRTEPVETALLPELQVPEIGVALWAELSWISCAKAGTTARKAGSKDVQSIFLDEAVITEVRQQEMTEMPKATAATVGVWREEERAEDTTLDDGGG